ncbi:MAG TPA: phasin family protein [Alphaproteobacteria bacterium]|nr:phasin family protein [Alphaproteobacteria bacterium]
MSTQKNKFDKFSQDAGSATRDAAEAYSRSGNVFWKGYESLVKTCTAMAQDSIEKQSTFFKKALSSKTLNEFTEIQNEAAQENFNDMMSGATKVSEICIKICTESFEPINDQISKSVRKASSSMAA